MIFYLVEDGGGGPEAAAVNLDRLGRATYEEKMCVFNRSESTQRIKSLTGNSGGSCGGGGCGSSGRGGSSGGGWWPHPADHGAVHGAAGAEEEGAGAAVVGVHGATDERSEYKERL